MAKSDWQFGIEKFNPDEAPTSNDIFSGSFDSANVLHELASAGIVASVELWRATGEQQYATKAIDLAKVILESQQRKQPDWDIPFTGFFYTSPSKEHILHYCHNGREQAPIEALTQLCEAFPDHPDWMKWYSAVTLYSEYLKKIAKYTDPYGVIPSSIYTDKEYLQVPESRQESFRRQVLNGIPLGKGHYLRLFPVWMDYRGHFGTILPKARALEDAARLRGDPESAKLAQHQLEWVVGRNPFSQSMMYGEGYDFTPLYTPSSGDIVGALPVGIQTRGDSDIPYWPVQSTWTYKEVWTHPVSQWIWLMCDPEIPLPVKGSAFGFEVSKHSSDNGVVILSAKVRGEGSHQFTVRSNNLKVKSPIIKTNLKPDKTITIKWQCKISAPDEPWVAIIIPDNDLTGKEELTGAVWERQ